MGPRDEVLDLIRQHLGRVNLIPVPVLFLELTGDTDSALLLTQLLYWTERARDDDGWVFKARHDWYAELHLNRYKLDMARRRLRDLSLIEEDHHLVGSRRILHLRVRRTQLHATLRALLLPEGTACGEDNGTYEVNCDADPAGSREACREDSRISNDRCAVDQPTGVPRTGQPVVQISDDRTVENEPFERSNLDHPRAETTTETTAQTATQTTPETTAENSSRSARAEKGGRRRAAEGNAATPDGVEGCSMETEQAKQPARQYYEVVCERRNRRDGPGKAEGVEDDVLFDVLERVPGFPRERDQSRLREILADYPRLDHVREFERFAEYWRSSTLAHPWLALRKWMERAQRQEPHPRAVEAARPFTWKRDVVGRCYVVRNDRASPSVT